MQHKKEGIVRMPELEIFMSWSRQEAIRRHKHLTTGSPLSCPEPNPGSPVKASARAHRGSPRYQHN